jgi:hypothetical protein
MTDKKEYKKVLGVCTSLTTAAAAQKTFAGMVASTEDAKLAALLKPCVVDLVKAHNAAAVNKQQNTKGVIRATQSPYKELTEYCKQCISSSMPDWQIIATQHGWKPPTA